MEKKTISTPHTAEDHRDRNDVDVYRCNCCNTEVKAKHRDLSQKVDMGIYLLNYITMLKYNFRAPIRKV